MFKPLDELAIACGCQTHDIDAVALGEQIGRDDRRLGRRAGDDDRVGAEEVLVGEEIIDEERREEKREEQDVFGLAVGRIDGVGLDVAVTLVGRRQLGTVRRGVEEALLIDAGRDDHQVAGARQVAVDPNTFRHAGMPGLLDVGVTPDVQLPPARVRRREEVPVVHRVTEHGVGDVVRGQPERLDAEQRLAVFKRRGFASDDATVV